MTSLSRRTITGYAAGSVGTGGFGTLPGLLLAYYLTDVLGVAALAASLVVLVPKLWDLVIDPLVGARSDAAARRRGDRRRLMLAGALLLPPMFALTFAVPPGFGPGIGAAWVVVAFVLTASAFSFFQVPYIALPAEITPDYRERTRLMSWRIAALAVSILVFGGGGPALRDAAGGGRHGYLVMGVVAGTVMGLGMLLSWWGAPRAAAGAIVVVAHAASVREQVRGARANRPFLVLLGVYVLQALATGAMLAAAQYVATYVLHDEQGITGLFLALVAPAVLVMPVWSAVASRWGKERGLLLATICFAVAAASLSLLQVSQGPWVYASVALAGVAYAGMQTFPLAMLPDTMSVGAAHGGGEPGSLAGVWTGAEAVGLACGPALVLLLLSGAGFISSTASDGVVQSGRAVGAIVAAFSVLPLVLVLASLVLLRRYPLREADVAAVASEPVLETP